MRIVIGGGGKVGTFLCQELSKANHDVFLIEMKEQILQDIIDMNDITGIVGNAADYETLMEAEIHRADMFIAVTSSDEVNMIAAIIHKGCLPVHHQASTGTSNENRNIVMAGHRTELIPLAWPGHPRPKRARMRTWMSGTEPDMTTCHSLR